MGPPVAEPHSGPGSAPSDDRLLEQVNFQPHTNPRINTPTIHPGMVLSRRCVALLYLYQLELWTVSDRALCRLCLRPFLWVTVEVGLLSC